MTVPMSLILAVNRPALAVIPYRQKKKSAVSSGPFRKSAGLILRPSFPLIRTTLRRPAPPLDAGADIINDVTAGTGDPDMLSVAKEKDAPLILMHMRGTPKTMMSADMKAYHNVVGDVMEYLLTRTEACEAMGIGRTKLMLDPGLGFAKDVSGNLELSRGLAELTGHGIPVLVAGSRKGYIGKVLGDLPPEEAP